MPWIFPFPQHQAGIEQRTLNPHGIWPAHLVAEPRSG
jgi:hypothetical protein